MKCSIVIIMALFCSVLARATETIVARKNQSGYLECLEAERGIVVPNARCIKKTEFVAHQIGATFQCLEKALVSDGSNMVWMYVDFAGRPQESCFANRPKRFFAYESESSNGRFACYQQALMNSVSYDNKSKETEEPKWMQISGIEVDQANCASDHRYVANVDGGMIRACYEQALVTLENGKAKWSYVDFADRAASKCTVNEMFRWVSSGSCLKMVEVTTTAGPAVWTLDSYHLGVVAAENCAHKPD